MAVVKFIQAQSFSLQASGGSIGDTSITLQSFKQIDGVTNIVTSDLGDKCYATLEPNNGTQEEAIIFTGVTQNSSGTATLTGVKSVGFTSPYTETSGLAKSHAGGVTVILSNDAGFYGNILTYVNTSLASGAPLANSTTAGISKLSVDPATGSNPIALGVNDPLLLTQAQKNYVASIINTGVPYATVTGTSLAYTATLASSISSLASGTLINFQVPTTNATGVTFNINSLGAKPITRNYNVSLASGDLVAGQMASVVYNGAGFQLTNPSQVLSSAGTTTHDLSTTTSNVIPHGIGVTPRIVRVTGTFSSSTSGTLSTAWAVLVGGVASYISSALDGGSNTGGATSLTFNLYGGGGAVNNGAFLTGTVTVDATNITIAWSKTSSPTGTANLLWETLV